MCGAGQASAVPKSPGFAVTFNEGTRQYLLSSPATPAITWRGITAGVKVDGAWLQLADFRACVWQASGGHSVLVCQGRAPLETLRVEFEHPSGTGHLVIQARARAAQQCRIEGFRLMHPPAAGGSLHLKESGDWFLFADTFEAPQIGALLRLDKMSGPVTGAWVSTLRSSVNKTTLGFASLSARLWPTWFEWKPSEGKFDHLELSVRAGGETGREAVRLAAGSELACDPVIVYLTSDVSPQATLERNGERIARANPRTRPPRRPEPGWCSWMYHAGRVGEAEVLRAADALKEQLFASGYRLVQVDGGWWTKRGDWRPNERFPHGLRWLSDEIHRRGLQFGLHLSPLRIDPDSELARNHPDWLLRSPDNSGPVAENGRYILDASHPGVLRDLRELFHRMSRDWRVDYFKLDFLNLGAREGLRHDASATGIAALRAALKAIRESVPERVVMLGSGMVPFAGNEYLDAMRVGPDINKPGERFGPQAEHAGMVWGPIRGPVGGRDKNSFAAQARAVARQPYRNSRLFVTDPETVLVTPAYTLEEARAHFSLVALTGGSLLLGDRLDTLLDERLALITHAPLLDIWREGRHAVPLDLFNGGELPRIWRLVRRSGSVVIGIFNWDNQPRDDTFELAELVPDTKGPLAIRDVWLGAPIPVQGGRIRLRQEPHSVRLVEATPGR